MSNKAETNTSQATGVDVPADYLVSAADEGSARARLEEAITICERRFSCLPGFPGVAAYACDTSGTLICHNQRIIHLLGDSFAKRNGCCCSGVPLRHLNGVRVTREDCPMALALMSKRPVFSDDLLLERSDGQHTRVSCQAEPVFDDHGNMIGAVNALLEIHEHIQTSRHEQLQARMLQQAGKAAICTDPLGVISFWNQASIETFGWKPEEVIGKNVMEIIRPQLTPEVALEIGTKLRAGESWDGQFKVQSKDGRVFTTNITASPILDDHGGLVGIVALGTDVDAETRAAEALKASEERYHTLFSSMSEGVALGEMMYDEQGNAFNYRCLDLNPAAEKCLGFPREVLLGRTLRDFVSHPNPEAFQHFRDVVSTGVPTRFEFFSEHLSKRFDVIAFRLAPLQFAVLLQDITEQRRTLEALKASENRFRSLYNAISGGVVVQDRDGKIVEANKIACEILGLSQEQLHGMSAYDPKWHAIKEDGTNAAPDDHPSVITRKTGLPVEGVVMGVFNTNENAYRWMIVNSQPILENSSGLLEAVVITFVDITRRKRAEEALRNNREQFEAFMDSLPGYAWIKDFQGRYLYLNKACIRTLKYKGDWKGLTAAELWGPGVAQKFDATDADVIKKGTLVQITDATGTDGRGSYLLTKFPIFRPNNDDSVICGLAIDATGIQRTMEQLRRHQVQLADANRKLEAEISKISEEERRRLGQDLHDDICQNLVGVSLLCGELAAALAPSNPSDFELATRIETMICEALKDIRSLARGLHPVTLERQGLVTALQELADRISSTKVPCTLEVTCAPIRRGHRAALSLYRIAQEALTNSLKHAEATELGIKLSTDGDALLLSITDNGIGIGKSNPQGMVLHIMDCRARAIGGTLAFSTPPNGGTTITCRIPNVS